MKNKKYQNTILSIKHLNKLVKFYKTINNVPFKDNDIEKIKLLILSLLKTDSFNKQYYTNIPINSLNILHLICEYKLAYESSKKELPESLALLKKGKKYRKTRRDKNIELLQDNSIEKEIYYRKFFENFFLDLLLDDKTENIGNLVLGLAFTYENILFAKFVKLSDYDQEMKLIITQLKKSLYFFSYTFLAPSKIVNSLTLVLYKKLKAMNQFEDIEIQKFIQNISNICFNVDAINIRKDYYKRDIYIAGIYNQSVIFQWNSSTKNKPYYSNYELHLILDALEPLVREKTFLSEYFIKFAEKKYNQKFDASKLDINTLRLTIDNLIMHYSLQPPKLISKLPLAPKTIKYYILSPLQYIITKFAALATKLDNKYSSQ